MRSLISCAADVLRSETAHVFSPPRLCHTLQLAEELGLLISQPFNVSVDLCTAIALLTLQQFTSIAGLNLSDFLSSCMVTDA